MSLAYDVANQEVLLFGGTDHSGYEGDTWVYGAGSWTNLTPLLTSAPGPRGGAAMAYSPTQSEVVLFGGYSYGTPPANDLQDTWAFQGGNWTRICASCGPSARGGASLTFDSALDELLLFGGSTTSATGVTYLNDLWAFGGSSWAQVNDGSTLPAGRADAGFAYDPALGVVLLFGGCGSICPLGDTWTFAGGTWTELSHGFGPSPRYAAVMAYDGTSGTVILVGGCGESGCTTPLDDVWSYESGGWFALNGMSNPPGRGFAGFAFDTSDGYLILLGGTNGTSLLSDAWAFAGTFLITSYSLSPSAVDVGQSFAANVTVIGGAGATYNWSGAPEGCTPPDAPSWSCRPIEVGTFVITVAVENVTGASLVSHATLEVSEPPSAAIDARPTSGPAPLTVTFTAVAHNGTTPLTEAWRLGQGYGARGTDVVHVYPDPGEFNVTLWVNDSAGESREANVTVFAAQPLTVIVSTPRDPVPTGRPVSIEALVGGGLSPYAYDWSGPAGSTGNGTSNLTFTPTATGTVDVALKVTDSTGESATGSLAVMVTSTGTGSGPSLGATVKLAQGLVQNGSIDAASVTLTNAVGTPTFAWWLNGTIALIGAGPSILFYAPHYGATYWVTASVTESSGATATGSAPLVVWSNDSATSRPPPLFVNLTVNSEKVAAGASVVFTAVPSGGAPPYTIHWIVNGTNTSETGLVLSVDFLHAGIYTYSIWAVDTEGNFAFSSPAVIVVEPGKTTPATSTTTPSLGGAAPLLVLLVAVAAAEGVALWTHWTDNRPPPRRRIRRAKAKVSTTALSEGAP